MSKIVQLLIHSLLLGSASAGMTSILLRAVSRADKEMNSAADNIAQTLNTFDANQDGRIDRDEVVGFANSEGLDAASATEDFSTLDANGDGVLDKSEILQVIDKSAQGEVDSTPGAERPRSLRRGFQRQVVTIKQPVMKPEQYEAKDVELPDSTQSGDDVENSVAMKAKPAPVERMAKHFAQVLGSAEVLPIRAKAQRQSAASARVTQSAAKEVAEQLVVAESAEAAARILDRRAAEQQANATVLAKAATQESMNVAREAAHRKAHELLDEISTLEDQAESAEVHSAALHAKAKMETEEASELMVLADKALSQAPSKN
jgi:hypothetical protein